MKLFKSVRHKMILKSKTIQYLKYALGEIVLVVIGILIAIQINNWNQAKKDQNSLNEYLVKIKSQTIQDIEQLQTLTLARKKIGGACKKAQNSILEKTDKENLKLFMESGFALSDVYFKPNSGGYESFVNSQYYGKINNTKLDSLLTKYHSVVDIIAEIERSYNEYVVYQENHIDTKFDRSLILAVAFIPKDSLTTKATTEEEYGKVFVEYTSKPAFRNIVSLAASQFGFMVDHYGELTDLGENIIIEIDSITKEN